MLRKLVEKKHVSPRVINDEFSGKLFDRFFQYLDPQGIYLTTADLLPLEKYRTMLDEEVKGQSWKFLSEATSIYRSALERAKVILQKQSESPFVAATKNAILFDTISFSANESALNIRWRNIIHFKILEKIAGLLKADQPTVQFFQQHEPDARVRVKNMMMRDIKRILLNKDGLDVFVAENFLDCITAAYDPHTNYFNLTNMEVFAALVSAEGFYFGFSLKENGVGNVVIASLAPGGPAWKSGEFTLQDELVALQWEDEEVIDLTDVPLKEVNALLDDANQMTLKLTLRKPSGELKTIELRKAKLSQEQNLVRGYVLDGSNGRRYGYIVLPEFYSQWDSDDYASTRCANDVAKEILKLSKEKIQGLILDVRYNGGGSLKEAIALSGIFIEEGSMAMMRNTGAEPISLKDMNRGTLYDGPMILMVNGRSASASEVVAAALQDYHRAVVVGSSTFGKATGQEVMPVDPNETAETIRTKPNFGFAKVTTSRIYRVTGKSLQGRGLVPDIILPDILDASEYSEAILENYLQADSIVKKSYYKPLPAIDIAPLREKSSQRVTSSTGFKALDAAMNTVMAELDREPIVLTWDQVSKSELTARKITETFQNTLEQETGIFKARVVASEKTRLDLDAYAKAFHDASITSMQTDLHLGEVFMIMNDLIDLEKK